MEDEGNEIATAENEQVSITLTEHVCDYIYSNPNG